MNRKEPQTSHHSPCNLRSRSHSLDLSQCWPCFPLELWKTFSAPDANVPTPHLFFCTAAHILPDHIMNYLKFYCVAVLSTGRGAICPSYRPYNMAQVGSEVGLMASLFLPPLVGLSEAGVGLQANPLPFDFCLCQAPPFERMSIFWLPSSSPL